MNRDDEQYQFTHISMTFLYQWDQNHRLENKFANPYVTTKNSVAIHQRQSRNYCWERR